MSLRPLFLCTALAFAFAAGAAEPIPLEHFLKPAQVEAMTLSPDGRFLATLVPREDRTDLAVLDRESMQPTAYVKPEKDEHISSYVWATDERLLVSLATRVPGTEILSPTGELVGVDVDNKNRKYLFGYRGGTQAGSRINRVVATYASAYVLGDKADADDRILIGIQHWQESGEQPYVRLARLHIHNGSLAGAGVTPVRYFESALTDAQDSLRFISGSEADRVQKLYYRADADAEWQLLNDAGKSGRTVRPLKFTRGGEEVYAQVDDGNGPAFFVRLNPETGEEKVLLRPKTASIGEVVETADNLDAFALQTHEGRGGYAFINGKTPEAQLTKAAMAGFPGESVIANSFSRDQRFATVFVYSDVNPGEYFLHDREANKLMSMGRRRPDLDPEQLAATEPFDFKARDGLQLYGFMTLPKDGKTDLPMVVLPHGGPYGIVERWGYDPEVQILANRGYAVLQLNFRGSGGYGEKFEDAGIGEWGGKMQDDLTDATRWVIEQKIADPQRICLYGGSYGGYAALMGVVVEPELYRCAIGSAGVYDLKLMKTRGDIKESAYGRNYLNEIFEKDDQWLAQRSPVQRAGEIKAAVMLIHGGEDKRVPPVHAERMRDALSEAGNAPEWLYKAREGHGFADQENRLEMYQKILTFLDQHIGDKKLATK